MADITRMGVIGSGIMGAGIAQVAAGAGLEVKLVDIEQGLLDKAIEKMGKGLGRLVEKGKMSQEDVDGLKGRITTTTSLKDLADLPLVVEAVPEKEELKAKIFSELDQVCGPDAILASNTSSISITRIGANLKDPTRCIGMHFMNPVPVMKLVEIVIGLATSDATYETTKALAEKMGKTTVKSDDAPGFIVNRILIPMINEACYALQEGVGSVSDIDTAMKLGSNQPMGPFELSDLIGNDTVLSIMQKLHGDLGDSKYRPCPILVKYVAAGWLGRKSGRGFHDYSK